MTISTYFCYPAGAPPSQKHLDLRAAVERQDAAAVGLALAAGASPLSYECDAMRLAAGAGGAPCLALLIAEAKRLSRGRSWGKRGCPSPLLVAVESEAIECVRLLIPEAEKEGDALLALSWAANGNYCQSLRELMLHCDPSGDGWFALLEAATIGNPQCVEILLEEFALRGADPALLARFAKEALASGRPREASMLEAALVSIELARSAPLEPQGLACGCQNRRRL